MVSDEVAKGMGNEEEELLDVVAPDNRPMCMDR